MLVMITTRSTPPPSWVPHVQQDGQDRDEGRASRHLHHRGPNTTEGQGEKADCQLGMCWIVLDLSRAVFFDIEIDDIFAAHCDLT